MRIMIFICTVFTLKCLVSNRYQQNSVKKKKIKKENIKVRMRISKITFGSIQFLANE
jgi:hypothetical protein